ncbi:hypothetical protein ACFQGT_19920 [Natrialbaceae archaeon GCM10025810]|uniref:hypothetical protein n=1 Tax=Halovalidus salilacus TaxID=3075124 RepID=UPI00360A30F8
MPEGESVRTVVSCSSCGSVYAAEKWPDGTVQPIGKRTGCDCGSNEFHVVEESDSAVIRDEEID